MKTQLSQILLKPLAIGNRTIGSRLVLAPMAALGHVAFREVLAGLGGCDLMFMEMCSAKSIPHENPKFSPFFRWNEGEADRLSCQIVGPTPEIMAAAARKIEDCGLWGVDINFGCSVSGICKKGGGAAVLKDPDRAVAIVAAVRREVSIPVTVKYRTGWADDPAPAVDLAKRFEDAGADALTFHPRVSPDKRSRPPKWQYIKMVKDAVSIPVFGNGNVFSQKDCLDMMTQTGCDGVSVGRLAIARPWIFAEWCGMAEFGPEVFAQTADAMADALEKHFEPVRALRLFQKFSFYFCANFVFGHQMLSSWRKARSMDEVREINAEKLLPLPQLAGRPNTHLFTV